MDRRRFLRVAAALAAGGATTTFASRGRVWADGEFEGFLPQVAGDGAAPIQVGPNSTARVMDAKLEEALGKFVFKDRLWVLHQGIREDDGWRTARLDGVVTSNMRFARPSFLGQFLDDSGEVASTLLVPLTWGSRTVINSPGGNNFWHFNTTFDLPEEAVGERFRGYFFVGAEVPGPNVVISRESDRWQLFGQAQRELFALEAEVVPNESYFNTGPSYSHRFSFEDESAGSPFVATVGEAGSTWVGNSLISHNQADLLYDFRPIPNLAGPRAVIDDFVVGAGQNRLFWHVDTPVAATDLVPVLSFPGLPPTTGQLIKASIWPGQTTPFIYTLPKAQTDGLGTEDFTLNISGYEKLVEAEFRASLHARPNVLFQGAGGLEVLTVIQNPFPTPIDLTGLAVDTWVVRNNADGEYEAAEGLHPLLLPTGTLGAAARRRFRQPASDWSDLHPSPYWPNEVQDAWSQVRSDPGSLTEEQRDALMRFGLPTSIRRP